MAGLAQQADDEVVEGGHYPPRVAARQARAVFAEGDVAAVMEAVLNGLITNDKLCVVRVAQLTLRRERYSAYRPPLGAGTARAAHCLPADMDQQGGRDEAAVARPARSPAHLGWAAAVGPSLSPSAELGGAATARLSDDSA